MQQDKGINYIIPHLLHQVLLIIHNRIPYLDALTRNPARI